MPPAGRIDPALSSTVGSSLGCPVPSMTHEPGNLRPSRFNRAGMLLAVIEAVTSTRIGSLSVGIPIANGFGVNNGFVPPKGATLFCEGSELAMMAMQPAAVAFGKKAARQPM